MTESRAIARPGSGAESDAGSHREVLSPEQREASQADPQRVTLRPSAYTLSDVEEDGGAPRTGAKPLIVSALILILVFFGGGLYWAATAPLSSAAIAPGVVTVAGNRKTIQHLEGGIVQDILVQEGDQVSAGQPLIELDDTKARAVLTPLRGQYYAALALRARLTAEWEDHDTIDFPEPLLARAGEPAVAQIMARQQDVFESRRETSPSSRSSSSSSASRAITVRSRPSSGSSRCWSASWAACAPCRKRAWCGSPGCSPCSATRPSSKAPS